MAESELYELRGIGKTFQGPREELTILDGIDLRVDAGESVAILGSSGSGKTTLLHLMGGLDVASRGEVRFRGRDIGAMDESTKAAMRNKDLGFVFQFHHLLPEFTTLENVAMQGLIAGMTKSEAYERAAESLLRMGLGDRLDHRVTTLSGGEQQRAAIARAMLMQPKALLADEPTGNLDERTGELVTDLLVSLNEETGATLVVVTHNHALANRMQRRLELYSGVLHEV
ncbi:ABC transporter ATP-binding protein [Oceanidesulfovibrio indonesiensis]|uniref:ABC transporter ATP-binding protein n=1 Tax=Oceanidesulfovibrio indonesiensis TaxID=54767 RepID=A0A7M3MEX9_9BACT|nr:ABC transporter ATP-binding protein [Oceanidesulfovibrio indonesiensis]TVM17139.1 ABC transporter ATP-binding protein [Oceanidesulfovibrio indonesiensis]